MIDVNAGTALWLTQAVAPYMRERGSGAIVHVAARPGLEPTAGMVTYGVSKAALVHLTRVLDLELRPLGIRVNAVAPQLIDTAKNRPYLPARPAGARDRARGDRRHHRLPRQRRRRAGQRRGRTGLRRLKSSGMEPRADRAGRAAGPARARPDRTGGDVSTNGPELGGSVALGPWRVHRAGYGAMQLAGDGVFGPPRDRDEALQVLRAAVAAGVEPHRHRSVLRAGHGQRAHPRGVVPLSDGPRHREQGGRPPRHGWHAAAVRRAATSCARASRTTSPRSAPAGWRR